jgi:predicted nucleic acid-binding protein
VIGCDGNSLTVVEIEGTRLLLEQQTTSTRIAHEVRGVATHPEDDLILATASSARADYLVTGDRQLQRLASYAGTKIVSPRQFLDILEEQEKGEGRS